MVSFNDTHITVKWSAPATPNGVVNYTVVLEARDLVFSNTVTIISEVVTQLFLIEELLVQPYTEYTAVVTARTSAGEGESTMGANVTDEAGTIVFYVQIFSWLCATCVQYSAISINHFVYGHGMGGRGRGGEEEGWRG